MYEVSGGVCISAQQRTFEPSNLRRAHFRQLEEDEPGASPGGGQGKSPEGRTYPLSSGTSLALPLLAVPEVCTPRSLQKAKFSGCIFINKSCRSKLLLSVLSDIYISTVSALALN